MHLTPTEFERMTIFIAAEMARRNLAQGVLLSHPEAVALISDEILLAARRDLSYDEVIDHAGHILDAEHVQPGVAALVNIIMVDAPFAEGTKLVTVVDPIAAGPADATPGEIIVGEQPVAVFDDALVSITAINRGDRDIQVRSHAHFYETNPALEFDRKAAWGRKLAVPAGGGIRFEPGVPVTVDLVPFGGDRVAFGFRGLVNGPLDLMVTEDSHASLEPEVG